MDSERIWIVRFARKDRPVARGRLAVRVMKKAEAVPGFAYAK